MERDAPVTKNKIERPAPLIIFTEKMSDTDDEVAECPVCKGTYCLESFGDDGRRHLGDTYGTCVLIARAVAFLADVVWPYLHFHEVFLGNMVELFAALFADLRTHRTACAKLVSLVDIEKTLDPWKVSRKGFPTALLARVLGYHHRFVRGWRRIDGYLFSLAER